ncbi:hypothetical protein FZM86_06805 [Enterococcus faecium]|nr:hypothetical protein [Enterococcus faecium]
MYFWNTIHSKQGTLTRLLSQSFFLFAVDYLFKIRFTFIYRMNHVHRRISIKGGDDKMQNVSYLKESGIFR